MKEVIADTLENRLGGGGDAVNREERDGAAAASPLRRPRKWKWALPRPPAAPECFAARLTAVAVAAVALLPSPASSLIPEFLSYKTCVDSPPAFSGCMSNVTADFGERVVLNCQASHETGGNGGAGADGGHYFYTS